jgi:hypothetical protein
LSKSTRPSLSRMTPLTPWVNFAFASHIRVRRTPGPSPFQIFAIKLRMILHLPFPRNLSGTQ